MEFLKQSTAATVKLGPFVDEDDGKTAETALSIVQADIRLSKNGGNMAQTNNITGATHDEIGFYDVPLDTTDTGTLGRLNVMVHKTGALPVFKEFHVLPSNVYDSLFSTDKLEVDVTQLGGATQSATDLKDFADDGYDPSTNKVQGVVLCDTVTTNTDTAAELAKVPKSDGTSSWNATALAAINAECDTAISDASLATAAELAKVPKSDGTTSWNATALAAINAECDTAILDAGLAADLDKVPKSDGTVSWNSTALAAINAECDTAISDASLATAAELAKVPKSDGTSSWNATALAAINAECDTAISDASLATAAELAKVPKSDGTTSWNATALGAINAECDTAISDASLATAAELAKVPKSDGSVTWNATALGSINSECDTAISDASLATAAALADGTVQVGTVQDGAIGAAAVADIFSTTTIAEAYTTDQAAGTPAQILYEILQSLTEFAISSTTLTVKKRDGTTTATTYTLDDDTSPTSRTRAT